jgi:hypothetical protein
LNVEIPNGVEYYVDPPASLNKPTGITCRLKKALYSLRYSPLYWFITIKPILEGIGFKSLDSDTYLFRYEEHGILLILYVDDLLVAAREGRLID